MKPMGRVTRCLTCVAAALVFVAAGCRTPGRMAVTPGELAKAYAVEWESTAPTSDRRTLHQVNDPRILAALLRYVKGARPSDPPGEQHLVAVNLLFHLPGGRKTQHRYVFDDLDIEKPGYVELAEGWFQVPGQFNIVLFGLAGYAEASGHIDREDEALLGKYGWTLAFRINTWTVTLPAEFRHRPGEYPEVLYWAYNNELNRDASLDLTPWLGRSVEVRLYKVAEPLPEFMHPRREAGRAVIVRHEGRIVGAWLDAGRHWGFACSLAGRRFEEVTGKTWDEWIPALIDPQDPLERELSRLSPEDLIRMYYAAVDRGDYARAHACESRKSLVTSLFANMDNRFLYNAGFRDYEVAGLANITSARVIAIQRQERFEENLRQYYPPGTRIYEVRVDLQVKEPVTFESGPQTRFVTLRRETPATGWRIEGIGTGP
ncbi:MAG: DUF4829 domain-containing protein [Bacillota bacterium]|nr:DUF4829 domain-containing protein [Bacillota bacterium]